MPHFVLTCGRLAFNFPSSCEHAQNSVLEGGGSILPVMDELFPEEIIPQVHVFSLLAQLHHFSPVGKTFKGHCLCVDNLKLLQDLLAACLTSLQWGILLQVRPGLIIPLINLREAI